MIEGVESLKTLLNFLNNGNAIFSLILDLLKPYEEFRRSAMMKNNGLFMPIKSQSEVTVIEI